MNFSTLGSIPNITPGTNIVGSSSFAIDSYGNPHIVWMEKKNGYYEVKYKFWDGIQWSFYNTPSVYRSNENIQITKYSLSFSYGSPIIVLGVKNRSKYSVVVAHYNKNYSSWDITKTSLPYNLKWVSVIKTKTSESSSSSVANMFVVTSDGAKIYVYLFDTDLTLIDDIDETIENTSTIRLNTDLGMIYVVNNDLNSIRYNYFNTWTNLWTFPSFATISNSILDEKIIDTDVISIGSQMFVGWISSSSSVKARHVYVDLEGNESAVSGNSLVKEEIPLLSLSSNYLNGGFRTIGIYGKGNAPSLILCGAKNIHLFSQYGSWFEEQLYFNGVNNVIQISAGKEDELKLALTCNNGVYFFKQNYLNKEIAYPEIYLLTRKKFYKSKWKTGELSVTYPIGCNEDDRIGAVLNNPSRPCSIIVTEEDVVCESSSSSKSSVSSASTSSSRSSRSSLAYSSSSSRSESSSSSRLISSSTSVMFSSTSSESTVSSTSSDSSSVLNQRCYAEWEYRYDCSTKAFTGPTLIHYVTCKYYNPSLETDWAIIDQVDGDYVVWRKTRFSEFINVNCLDNSSSSSKSSLEFSTNSSSSSVLNQRCYAEWEYRYDCPTRAYAGPILTHYETCKHYDPTLETNWTITDQVYGEHIVWKKKKFGAVVNPDCLEESSSYSDISSLELSSHGVSDISSQEFSSQEFSSQEFSSQEFSSQGFSGPSSQSDPSSQSEAICQNLNPNWDYGMVYDASTGIPEYFTPSMSYPGGIPTVTFTCVVLGTVVVQWDGTHWVDAPGHFANGNYHCDPDNFDIAIEGALPPDSFEPNQYYIYTWL